MCALFPSLVLRWSALFRLPLCAWLCSFSLSVILCLSKRIVMITIGAAAFLIVIITCHRKKRSKRLLFVFVRARRYPGTHLWSFFFLCECMLRRRTPMDALLCGKLAIIPVAPSLDFGFTFYLLYKKLLHFFFFCPFECSVASKPVFFSLRWLPEKKREEKKTKQKRYLQTSCCHEEMRDVVI